MLALHAQISFKVRMGITSSYKPFIFVPDKTQSCSRTLCPPKVVQIAAWVFITAVYNFLKINRSLPQKKYPVFLIDVTRWSHLLAEIFFWMKEKEMILNLICFARSVYREHPADKSDSANPQVQRERQVGQEKMDWLWNRKTDWTLNMLFLTSSVIWSLIWTSTTRWASETHSFWEAMHAVGANYILSSGSKTVVFFFLFWMVGFCFSADQRIKPMILVVKKWARHNQINDASKGTLSSYTLVLMVLHYLQSQYKHKYANTNNFCELNSVNPVFFSMQPWKSQSYLPFSWTTQ